MASQENYIKVYDGEVRLIGHYGGDTEVVQAARTSFIGGEVFRSDYGLIDYLIRHRHTSPLEQVNFTFYIEIPLIIAIHFIRHRTARLNSESGRYSQHDNKFYVPLAKDIRQPSKINKQGGGEQVTLEVAEMFLGLMHENHKACYERYLAATSLGIALEHARMLLPPTCYIRLVYQIDMHNLFKMLLLRLDSKAQIETRAYARAMADLIKPLVPHSYSAFENHWLNAVNLSADEITILGELFDPDKLKAVVASSDLKASRQREFLGKFRLGT